jgi:hypothetical protein
MIGVPITSNVVGVTRNGCAPLITETTSGVAAGPFYDVGSRFREDSTDADER